MAMVFAAVAVIVALIFGAGNAPSNPVTQMRTPQSGQPDARDLEKPPVVVFEPQERVPALSADEAASYDSRDDLTAQSPNPCVNADGTVVPDCVAFASRRGSYMGALLRDAVHWNH